MIKFKILLFITISVIVSCGTPSEEEKAVQLTKDLQDLTKRMDSAIIASRKTDSLLRAADTFEISDFQFEKPTPEGAKKIEYKGDTFQSYSKKQ